MCATIGSLDYYFFEFYLQDSKYLGELGKCSDPDSVRCCGVSSRSTVGLPIRLTSTAAPLTTEEILLLNRFAEIESTEPSNIFTRQLNQANPTTFTSDSSTTDAPFTTTDGDAITTVDDNLLVTTITTETNKSYTLPALHLTKPRHPKVINNVFMIYPSEMSGIPQTSPRNMPENNEMKMIDEETGLKVHLIFATNSTEPSVTIASVNAATSIVDDTASDATTLSTTTTTTRSRNGQYKKRRRYRPGRGRQPETVETTTHSSNNTISTPVTSSRSAASRLRLAALHNKKKQIDPLKISVTTTPPDRVRTKHNRSRLFNSSNRLNFLRKNQATTTGTPDDEESSSEAIQSITTTQPDIEIIPVTIPTPNRRFMSRVDKQHEYMIEAVRLVLMSASSEDSKRVVDAPKSFRDRMTNIEQMLVNTLNTTFVEMAKDQKMNRPYRGQKRFGTSEVSLSYLAGVTTPAPASRPPPAIERATRPAGLRRYRIWPTASTTPVTLRAEDVTKESKETPKNVPRRRLRLNFRNSEKTTSTTTETPPTTVVPEGEPVTDEIGTTQPSEIASTTIEDQPEVDTDIPAALSVTSTPHLLLESTISMTPQLEPTTDLSRQPITIRTINLLLKPTEPPAPTVRSPGSLIAEFKPSPSWALNNEQIHTIIPKSFAAEHADVPTTRQSRGLFREPKHFLGGFVPMVATNARNYNSEPELLIVGPIPRPHPVRDEGLIRFKLPAITSNVRPFR